MHPLNVWRKDQNYTLAQTAEFLEVPYPTLTDWIYFRRFPRHKNISLIVKKTGGSVTAEALQTAWFRRHDSELSDSAS